MDKTKIDFSMMEIYTNVAHTQCVRQDIREMFGDYIYTHEAGVAAKSLALKIYQSEGPTEFDGRECNLLRLYASHCTPAIYDAIMSVLPEIEE